MTQEAVCDDCGGAAQIVVCEMITRGVDVLCWQCMMQRAINVAARLADFAREAGVDAQGD